MACREPWHRGGRRAAALQRLQASHRVETAGSLILGYDLPTAEVVLGQLYTSTNSYMLARKIVRNERCQGYCNIVGCDLSNFSLKRAPRRTTTGVRCAPHAHMIVYAAALCSGLDVGVVLSRALLLAWQAYLYTERPSGSQFVFFV